MKGVGKYRAVIAAAALLAGCGWLGAQVQIMAQAEPSRVAVGERFSYTVVLSGGTSLPDVTPPTFEHFDIVMGPSTSTSFQMINGRVSNSQTLSWVLRAKTPGTFSIAAPTAGSGRKAVTGNAVTVEVVPSSTSSYAPDEDPLAQGSTASPPGGSSRTNARSDGRGKPSDVFVTAHVDKNELYRLDMLTVTYTLYTRVNVSSYNIAKLPQATGFWREEIMSPSRPVVRDVTVRGEPYKAAVIRKDAFFPTRTGTLELDPLIVDVVVETPVQRRSRYRDPFDFFGQVNRENKSVSSDLVQVSVKDLPAAGRPANFKGDVGRFDMSVNYDQRELTQHDALTLKITLSGKGYIKSVDAPKLELPSGFEQFDPTVDESVSFAGGAMQGRKTFTYLVIPRRSGDFTLDPVTFSYFDPVDGAYKSLRAGGRTVRVAPAEGGDIVAYGSGSAEVAILDRDIRFIKDLKTPLESVVTPTYQSFMFYVSLAAAPLLFLFGMGAEAAVNKRRSDPVVLRRRRAPEQYRRLLKSAGKLAGGGNTAGAVEACAEALAELVGAVIGSPAAGLTSEEMRSGLQKLGVEEGTIKETLDLMTAADRMRFGGKGVRSEEQGGVVNELLERFEKVGKALGRIRGIE